MATIEFIPVAICPDCALWAANNDDSGASEDWTARVDQPMADPEDPRTVRQYISTLIVEADEDSEEHFSWSTCHGCGDQLAGTRLDACEPA